MQVTDAMVAAFCRANPHHHDLSVDEIRAGIDAALAEMWRPIEEAPNNEVVLVCGFARDGYYVADAKKVDGEWMLFDQYNDDFTVESSGHTAWQPLPAPPMEK